MPKRGVVSIAPVGESRAERKQRRAAERALTRRDRRPVKTGDSDTAGFKGLGWGELFASQSGWGPAATTLPVHQATSKTLEVAFPFLNGVGLGTNGIYMGRIKESGAPFCVDPWEWYGRGLVTATSMLGIGDIGSGKSSTFKAYVTRQFALGRKCAVVSDPKGEWAAVAEAVGGEVIRIGPGLANRLNPLDAPPRDFNAETDDEYDRRVFARRQLLLISVLTTVLRRELKPAELTIIDVSLHTVTSRLGRGGLAPTLNDVFAELDAPSSRELQEDLEATRELRHGLRRLVQGDLAGMFDGQSTVKFDANRLMTVMDTGAFEAAGEDAKNLATLLASEWLESAIAVADGSQWNVVYDEGYRLLRNKHQVQRMSDHWKMARHYGLTNILIMHRVSDLDAIGEVGSEQRELAQGLLADTQIKIVGQQEPKVIEATRTALGLSDTVASRIGKLGKGEFVWVVNGRPFDVQTHLTDDERDRVFNTDARMGAGGEPEPEVASVQPNTREALGSEAKAPQVAGNVEQVPPVPPSVVDAVFQPAETEGGVPDDVSNTAPQPIRVTPVLFSPGPAQPVLVPEFVAPAGPAVRTIVRSRSKGPEGRSRRKKRTLSRVGMVLAAVVFLVGAGIGAVTVLGGAHSEATTSAASAVTGLVDVPAPLFASMSTAVASVGVGTFTHAAWTGTVPDNGAATATNAHVVTVTPTEVTLYRVSDGGKDVSMPVSSSITWVAGAVLGGENTTVWLDGATLNIWNPTAKKVVQSTLAGAVTASQTGSNPLLKVGDSWEIITAGGAAAVRVPDGMQPVASDDGLVTAGDSSGAWAEVDATGHVTDQGALTSPLSGATFVRWITAGWGTVVAAWSDGTDRYVTVQSLTAGTVQTMRVTQAWLASVSVSPGVNGALTNVGGLIVDLASGSFIADISASTLTDVRLIGGCLTATSGSQSVMSEDFAQVYAISTTIDAAPGDQVVTVTGKAVAVYSRETSK